MDRMDKKIAPKNALLVYLYLGGLYLHRWNSRTWLYSTRWSWI